MAQYIRAGKLLFAFVFVLIDLIIRPLFAHAATMPQVRIAYGAFNEKIAALWIASEQGLFRNHGINAEVVNIQSGPLTMAALASGDIQVVCTGPGAILSAAAGGMDVAFFAGIVNRPDGDFVVAPSIRKPEDLKGRIIGVQSVGGGVWSQTMLALEYLGLEPIRDKILVRVVGDPSVQVQSLVTGVIDGAWLTYTFSGIAQEKGFRVLLDLGKAPIPYQSMALATQRSYLKRYPQTVDALLRGILESISFIQNPANSEIVLKSLAKNLRLKNVQAAQSGYQMLQWIYSLDIRPNLKGIENMHRLFSMTNPKIKGLNPAEAVDEGPVQRLEGTPFFRDLVSQTKK